MANSASLSESVALAAAGHAVRPSGGPLAVLLRIWLTVSRL